MPPEKARLREPAMDAAPEAITLSAEAVPISKLEMALELSVRGPEMESVPIELPGAKMPPDWMVVVGRVPVPPMVPPELTVRLEEDAIEPLTESLAPLATVVAPVYVLAPERMMLPPVAPLLNVRAPVPENMPLKVADFPF